MIAVIDYPELSIEMRDTNHPGLKWDGVFLYEWVLNRWMPASIATFERYQDLIVRQKQRRGA